MKDTHYVLLFGEKAKGTGGGAGTLTYAGIPNYKLAILTSAYKFLVVAGPVHCIHFPEVPFQESSWFRGAN